MPTRSNNFALETTRGREEEDDDVADVGSKAGRRARGGISRGGTRWYIKKFLRHEWTSDLASAGKLRRDRLCPKGNNAAFGLCE